jgi:hypothetical protein
LQKLSELVNTSLPLAATPGGSSSPVGGQFVANRRVSVCGALSALLLPFSGARGTRSDRFGRSFLASRASLAKRFADAVLGDFQPAAQQLDFLFERIEAHREFSQAFARRSSSASCRVAFEIHYFPLDFPKIRDRDAPGHQRKGQDKRRASPFHPISPLFPSQSEYSNRVHPAPHEIADYCG